MNLDIEKIGNIAIVKVNESKARVTNAELFKDILLELIEDNLARIVVDLSNVKFMDSTFLGALVVSLKRVVSKGGDLRLVSCNCKDNPVWIMFEATRMYKIFKVFDTVEQAVQSFNNTTEE